VQIAEHEPAVDVVAAGREALLKLVAPLVAQHRDGVGREDDEPAPPCRFQHAQPGWVPT
jgi:hypothetical protein